MRTVALALILLVGCAESSTSTDPERVDTPAESSPDVPSMELTEPDVATADDVVAASLPLSWRVEVPADAPSGVGWAADDLVAALEKMGRQVAREALSDSGCAPGEGRIRLGDEAALATDQTWRITETRCDDGGRLVVLEGGGLLGRQYAVYDFLHRVGARFFHPEQEWYPEAPLWPEQPLAVEQTPAIRWRSVSLHLTHPLELGDAFRLGKPEYEDEARRYIDWQIKNLASYGEGGVGTGARANYGLERGFLRAAGLGLYGQQQGASGLIDPDSPKTAEEQLAEAIEARFAAPDTAQYPIRLFSVGFQPTEFTTEPEDEVVTHLRYIAEYLEAHHPDVMLMATFHATYKEPSEKYGVSPYALMVPAHERYGVNVHTLMFYDLERPAPVYGNTDFHYLEDFMREHASSRRLWYFPESAWWLTFDLPVPLYLPITIEARSRDLQRLKDLIDTTWQTGSAAATDAGLDGHRVFGSGHEWGYWQNEYCSFRMAADLSYDWRACVHDITTPMGPAGEAVAGVVEAVVAHQQTVFFDAELLRYLVGTDHETEAAAALGVVFHPLPPTPEAVLSWTADELETWETKTRPRLEEMATAYGGFLATLEGVAAQVPDAGAPFFREIRDGVAITGLRARHAAELYGALAARRHAVLLGGDDKSAEGLATAKATTQEALGVIHRREADYRYAPLERSIGGGESLDGDQNWTIYPYRYLGRTHWGFYWAEPDRRVADGLAGAAAGERVLVADALQPVGSAHTLTALAASPGGTVDWGDGATESLAPGAGALSHTYAAPGAYTLKISFEGGTSQSLALGALVTETVTGKTGTATEPAGVSIIDPLLPGLVFGALDDGTGETPQVAVGFALDNSGDVAPARWVALPRLVLSAGLKTVPANVVVPIVNGSVVLTEIGLIDAVFRTSEADPTRLSGALSTEELIGAVVEVGGFEPEGARALVASLLGLTPDTLPETLSFVVAWPR